MVLKKDRIANRKLEKPGFVNNIIQANWVKWSYYTLKNNFKGLMKLFVIRRLISNVMAKTYSVDAPVQVQGATPMAASVNLGYAPWERRANVLKTLQTFLKESGCNNSITIKVCWFNSVDFECAVLDSHKKGLFHLLQRTTEKMPEVEVIFFKGDTLKARSSEKAISLIDLYEADFCKIGVPAQWDLAQNGYVPLLFVASDKRGCLAYNLNARKVDWSREFSAQQDDSSSFNFEEKSFKEMVGEVDLVYTWVEANDLSWQQDRKRYSNTELPELESSVSDERYINRDELKYSLRSVHLYAPFIRRIFIVTADQIPDWLNTDSDLIRLVSHRDIFPEEQMLPTFNSHSIEACLHRIEGLSEHFIYFNDDFFLGSEVSKADFFTVTGLLKIYLSRSQRIPAGRPSKDGIPTDWAAYNANALINRDFGLCFDRKLKHYPYALRKSILQEIEEKYPQEIRNTRLSRFRSNHDLALPSMFSAFYTIATERGVEWPDHVGEYVYADTGEYSVYKALKEIAKNRPRFFCLNSTRNRVISLEQQEQLLKDFLAHFYPYPSPFENASEAVPKIEDCRHRGGEL